MKDKLPLVGITMGDPTGVGPEIVTKALNEPDIYSICTPLVVGDARVIQQACKIAKVNLGVNPVKKVKQGKYKYGVIDILDLQNVDMQKLVHKRVDVMGGKASLEYIDKVIDLALAKEIDATVTCPIHKKAINLAGCPYAGHTEIYAHRTGTKDYAMMLIEGKLRIVHVTGHIPLKDVPLYIKKERVLKVIRLAHKVMRKLGIENPRIVVAGLNPHASDGGLFGDEERKEIAPAVKIAKEEGIDVEGPFPPDTAFVKLKSGRYDVALAMYHDQGHIPIKFSGFSWDAKSGQWTSISGVNVTLGLPIIRTSVDHGVAHDIAGEGKASPDSLIQAIKLASRLAKGYKLT